MAVGARESYRHEKWMSSSKKSVKITSLSASTVCVDVIRSLLVALNMINNGRGDIKN